MLNRLSIRYKIGLIALIGLMGFVVFQTASYRLSINLRDQMQLMISEDFTLLQFANEVQVNFTELDKLYQAALTEADLDTLVEADAKAMQMKLRFESMKTRFNINDPDFSRLIEYFNSYVNKASTHTASVISDQLDYEKTFSGYSEVSQFRERYQEVQKQFLDRRYQLFEEQLKSIEYQSAVFVKVGLFLGILLSLLLVLFSMMIVRRLITAFNNAVNVAEQIAKGNLDQQIEILAQDETGQLITSLTVMRDALKKQKEDNFYRENVQSFLAGLNEVMRGDKNIEELAQVILNYLVTELHAQVGVFYVLESDVLTMLANHAYPENDQLSIAFKLGETIVGQAGIEQRIKIVNDIPDNYVQVGSAIGRAMPRSLLLFPVVFEEKLKAVIEIGAFRRFSEDDVHLMHLCNDAIAVSFNSAQSRYKVSSMLHQTQEQAVELKKQRQELALFNRQLEEKTFYLDSQRNEILEKNRELERSGRELIEKSQALELSGKYKSQFLSTMSHELRTPLNSILILSEALIENRNAHLDDREIQHARVINNAGADLLALINDILDLSKVEEGKMEVVIDEITMQDFALGFAQQFEYMAKEKGLEYKVNVASDVPAICFTDRHRLKQIIKNFISNALKFTQYGGVYLDILMPDATFKLHYPHLVEKNILLFKVTDTGVGIPKAKQLLVFEAFKQADGTTSRKYGGTGLGLTISLALAKLLGGDIVLESEGENKGSSFILVLPLSSAAPRFNDPEKNGDHTIKTKPTMRTDSSAYSEDAQIFDFHMRDELLFMMDNSNTSIDFVKIASGYNLDCFTENDPGNLKDLLHHQHFYVAFIEADCLGENYLEHLKMLAQQVDRVYVLASPDLEKTISELGCFFVPYLKNESQTRTLINEIVEYQASQSGKVLVIEDNPVFQQVLRSVFTSHHLNVSIASDGQQALAFMHQTLFDCLIVDLNLPDYKGIELLEIIRSNSSYQDCPVIVFTAEDLNIERQNEIKKYASQILLKTPKVIIALCENVKRLIFERKIQRFNQNTIVPVYEYGNLKNRCILLVDDDPRNIYSITAILETEGMRIFSARSGKEALELLHQHPEIEMLLLDIMMPEMDGYEVLRIIRNDASLTTKSVITLTAKAMVEDKQKSMDAGATDYLSKPVDKDTLLNCILRHMPVVE